MNANVSCEDDGCRWRGISANDKLGFYPPPCGEGRARSARGGGRCEHAPRATTTTPTPNSSPAGCGLARFRQILKLTKPRQAGVWLGRGADRVRGANVLQPNAPDFASLID